MRRTLIAAALLLGTAAAPPPATKPPAVPAPAGSTPEANPAQDAAEDMMLIYEDVCLGHFPNPAAVRGAVADAHATLLTDAQARDVLMGKAGSAWAFAAPHGRVVVAVDTPPSRMCVVTGQAAEDEGVQAVFDMLVTSTAKDRDYGALVKRQQQGSVGGHAATMQLIGAAPGGGKRQAFINMGVANADGSTQLRLSREFGP